MIVIALLLAMAAGTAAPDSELAGLLPEFVTVPAGEYRCGVPPGEPGARDDEHPVHTVVLTVPVRLARTEVTRALWRAVTGEPGGYFAACGDDCPAESMTWYEAVEFCNALSRRLGLEPVYRVAGTDVAWVLDADGFRLPTEHEWEIACRAGTETPYACGRCLGTDQANFNGYTPLRECRGGLYREEPLPVGSFRPNAAGLLDMHGNVHEWCWDLEGPYPEGPVTDPRGPDTGERRALRGGGWISTESGCRSGVRYFIQPGRRFDFVGLRLARSGAGEGGR